MHHSHRKRTRWLFVRFMLAAAAGLPASPGLAQLQNAVASGSYFCRALGNSDSDGFTSEANTVSIACDVSSQSGDRFAEVFGEIKVGFYDKPIVDVQLSSATTNALQAQVSGVMEGTLTYDTVARFKQVPPFFPNGVPLSLVAQYSMTNFGTFGSRASVTLDVEHPAEDFFFQETRELPLNSPNPMLEGSYRLEGLVQSDELLTIMITANCSVNPGDNSESDCQAVIDPVITFDQEAFDQIHGANSFVLADFMEIVTSPNLGSAIDGDYNGSGLVEQGDLNLVLSNWGASAAPGDVPLAWVNDLPTGIVDQAELNLVLNNWGVVEAPGFGGAVPEPGAAVMIVVATLVSRRNPRATP